MPQLQEGYFIEDLSVGMRASCQRTISTQDIAMFSSVSGDTNPIHTDEVYARGTRFRGCVAHGMLTASLISAVIGTRLPGTGAIYLSQSLNFRAPVRIGDSVVASVEVASINLNRNRVVLNCACHVGDQIVVDGEAVVMVPDGTPT